MIYSQHHLPTAIKAFSGKREDFWPWNQLLIETAIAFGNADPQGQGVNGFLSNDADYQAAPRAHGAAAVFVPRPHPGDRPVLAGPAPDAAAVAIHADACKIHDKTGELYYDEQRNKAAFKLLMCGAVPEWSLAVINDPITGLRNRTIRQIYVHLIGQFLTMSPTDLAESIRSLDVQFDPNTKSVVEHIADHRRIHALQASNNSAMPETRKVHSFIGSLTAVGYYEPRILHYQIAQPLAAAQTFLEISTAIQEFEMNSNKTTTSKAAGYAAAMQPPPAAQPIPAIAAAAAGAGGGGGAAPAGGGGGGGAGGGGAGGGGRRGGRGGRGLGRGGRGGAAGRPPIAYCWTHGACHHPSPVCQNKAAGHQDGAIFTNQMGGVQA